MKFFEKIKSKLKTGSLIYTVEFILLAAFCSFLCYSNGFSSDKRLFIPAWVISCVFILLAVISLSIALLHLRAYVLNTKFNKLIKVVEEIGDIDTIGEMLESMDKSKFVKSGELKFNEKIIFYKKGYKVIIIPPEKVRSIKTEIVSGENGDKSYVRIAYGLNSLRIKTGRDDNLLLVEQLKKTFKVFD